MSSSEKATRTQKCGTPQCTGKEALCCWPDMQCQSELGQLGWQGLGSTSQDRRVTCESILVLLLSLRSAGSLHSESFLPCPSLEGWQSCWTGARRTAAPLHLAQQRYEDLPQVSRQ